MRLNPPEELHAWRDRERRLEAVLTVCVGLAAVGAVAALLFVLSMGGT